MDKNLKINKDAGDLIVSGINKLANIVKVTMGPKGKLVLIEDFDGGFPIVTKDGVTVSEQVDLVCQYEKMGARLIQQAGRKLLEETADSTTTATVLTQALVNSGLNSDKDFRELQKNYSEDFEKVKSAVLSLSSKVKKSELIKVATISANGDQEVGRLVAEAFKAVGENGNVVVDDLYRNEVRLDIQEGFKIGSGFMSPNFITNLKLKEVHLERPLVLISNSEINHIEPIKHVMEFAADQNRNILILCPAMADDVMNTLIYNRHMGYFNGCVVRLPEVGARLDDLMQDLMFLTGAELMNLENDFEIENLGEVDFAYIRGTETSLSINDSVNTDGLIKELKEELKKCENFEKSWIKKRIGSLVSKVATIKVGGASDGERKERRDRVDDAVGSVRSSFSQGVIPGGGTLLYHLADTLELSEEFREAIKAPFKTILENGGIKLPEVFQLDFNQGYNLYNGEFIEDMKSEGILDSTLSILKALEVSVSISKTVLQTGGLILTRN